MAKVKYGKVKEENYIPFDFANLISDEKVKEINKQYGKEISDSDVFEIKKFLQVWLEVLYLQFKRQQILENEQQEESNLIHQGEYRRAS